MKDVKDLLKRIASLDAEQQAKAISNFVSENKRKRNVEDARRDIRAKCFAGCKKLTKAQQEAFLYEFLSDNHAYVNKTWLAKKHPELFEVNQ